MLSRPVILGSWARGELCPRSDLDVLFLGPEKIVGSLVADFQKQGLKIRSRIPLDSTDLTKGVESFDILNLLQAKAFFPDDQRIIESTQDKILHSRTIKQKILKAILKDRKKRADQFDSLSNLLEPHLKSSSGGLRDIEQALQIWNIFADRFTEGESSHALQVLGYAKVLFLQLRAELHVMGLQDHLISTAQLDLSQKYGFAKSQDFMKEVSRGFSRAHFYSDWVFEVLSRSPADLKKVAKLKFQSPRDALPCFKKDSSVLVQKRLRTEMDSVFARKKLPDTERGRILFEAILFKTAPGVTQAFFRSRVMDYLCPHIRPLIGYVQHDQYHRWTADRHLLQTCLELKQIFAKPSLLFGLKQWYWDLKKLDWQILSWVCLYHDLAKGQGRGHAEIGEELVREDFKKFKISEKVTEEVAFLVRNHLELSVASFRKNPQSENTWKDFWAKGMTPDRLRRLAIFTVIDIRATHPEAWNSWKAELLTECVRNLLAPEKEDFFKLKIKWGKTLGPELVETLDIQTLKAFTPSLLAHDLLSIQKAGEGQSIKVLQGRKGRIWVRFYREHDELGLFESFVRSLFQAGINIEQAIVQTLPGFGVYDLFQISKRQVPKAQRLRAFESQSVLEKTEPPEVELQRIELVSESPEEIILSFQGSDRRGLLWAIAAELKNQNLFILKARVHTWGGQIEDLIHIKSGPQTLSDLQNKIAQLRRKFCPKTS